MAEKNFRSGQVALIGRPNVGKSTLLNALVGEKISIVTAKPHTTRNRIIGVMNRPEGQAVFVDTPGFSQDKRRVLHRLMARSIHQVQEDSDLIVLVTEANRPIEADAGLIEQVIGRGLRSMLVINKIDRLDSREALLPRIESLRHYPFVDFVPVSALSGNNLDSLAAAILQQLPEGPPLYPSEFKTDKSERFRAAEIVREKLMSELHQEVPYGVAVEIEAMDRDADDRLQIRAVIWVERESHKAITIGQGGRVLKRVGRAARLDLNELLGEPVHIELWVKVREHWSDNAEELRRLGLDSP